MAAAGDESPRLTKGPLQAGRDLPVGGQAVLEGVMMRGVSTWAVAVRLPTAEQIADGRRVEPDEKPISRGAWIGTVTLALSLSV